MRAVVAGDNMVQYDTTRAAVTGLTRPGTPQEVAACILSLASDEASFVTGTCLVVDGGPTAM